MFDNLLRSKEPQRIYGGGYAQAYIDYLDLSHGDEPSDTADAARARSLPGFEENFYRVCLEETKAGAIPGLKL